MTMIDKIRAKIERLIKENDNIRCDSNKAYCQGYDDAFVDLLSFLDAPADEPVSDCHDLEEEISTWIPAHISGGDDEVWRDTKNAVTEWAGIVARHFAEWQKRKMMKGAVKGEVYKFGEVVYVKEHNNAELTKYLSQFNNGDSVKIIVVHETDIR